MLLGGRVQVALCGSGGAEGERGVAGVACDPPIIAGHDPLPLRLPKRPRRGGREGGRQGGRRGGREEGRSGPGAAEERGQV